MAKYTQNNLLLSIIEFISYRYVHKEVFEKERKAKKAATDSCFHSRTKTNNGMVMLLYLVTAITVLLFNRLFLLIE